MSDDCSRGGFFVRKKKHSLQFSYEDISKIIHIGIHIFLLGRRFFLFILIIDTGIVLIKAVGAEISYLIIQNSARIFS